MRTASYSILAALAALVIGVIGFLTPSHVSFAEVAPARMEASLTGDVPAAYMITDEVATSTVSAVQDDSQASHNASSSAIETHKKVIAVPPAQRYPVKITIASSGTDAKIIPVGVTAEGNLDTPHNFVEAGWYEYGTIPGQKGSAVIDGHVDNGASIPGIFKHLNDVKPGDDVAITMSDGSVLHFDVTGSAVYPTKQFPSQQIFTDSSGDAVLKIITCHGTFIHSEDTYDQRLVVTAVLRQ